MYDSDAFWAVVAVLLAVACVVRLAVTHSW
jgi:hypothetical protein